MARPSAQQYAQAPAPFVALQTDDGFRVYSPADPKTSFRVSGSVELPRCTCPEFLGHPQDGTFRCAHIRAVESQLPVAYAGEDDMPYAPENGHGQAPGNGTAPTGHETVLALPRAQMMLKRSVSTDGRIDSLSVELSRLLDGENPDEVRESAGRMLALQEEIVQRFLTGQHGKGNGQAHDTGGEDTDDGAVEARLLGIGGMNTRWGWRLFLNVQVNGDTVKLFGKNEQLADAIRAAGYPDLARQRLADGMKLDLPCRVFTSTTGDGKYTVIARVLPANGGRPR